MATTNGTEVEHQVLTVAEVASLWSVHPDTVRRWVRERRLPAVRTPAGRLRFRAADMDTLTDGGADDG